MVTRPLDLARRLRSTPRSFDTLYFVNAVLIALFFSFFGSRFVLSPALEIGGVQFQLPGPVKAGGAVGMQPGDVRVSIKSNGQIFVEPGGLVSEAQLREWLAEQRRRFESASLLVRADAGVPVEVLGSVTALAENAGFKRISMAYQTAPGAPGAP